MATYFLDSSAIVKLYIAETGSQWLAEITIPTAETRVYIVKIACVEVVAALARRAAFRGRPQSELIYAIKEFRNDFSNRFRIVEISTSLVSSAMDLSQRQGLRGYDAVQLAGAVEVNAEFMAFGSRCTLVSADLELNSAAIAEGLTVENPNDHP